MEIYLYNVVRIVLSLGGGAAIGYGFGLIQAAAQRRNDRRQQSGELKNPWGVMPGSGLRVACLLLALVAIQVICPVFFADGTQWLISAGVAGGYGSLLFKQLQERRLANSAGPAVGR
jgi:hypothetical protein